jgi:hypothetical protein
LERWHDVEQRALPPGDRGGYHFGERRFSARRVAEPAVRVADLDRLDAYPLGIEAGHRLPGLDR